MSGQCAAPLTRAVRLALASLALAAGLAAAISNAQDTSALDPCDPKLARPAKDPLAYGRRGERCEGLYLQDVAGSAGLLIASLTEPVDPFDFSPGQRVRVEWSAAGTPPLRLRAVALRRRLYYRMDAQRPAGATVFEWPTDILASLKMRVQELGLVGWIEQRVGERTEEVYVPLRVGQGPVTRTGRYVVLIVPGTELSELYLTLTEVGRDGRDASVLKQDEALRYGYYPAERSIRIPLPPLDRAAVYRLQLGATLSRGGSATKTVHFYHAGR
jgi:hypothetical protein